jgi:hypothetical protein
MADLFGRLGVLDLCRCDRPVRLVFIRLHALLVMQHAGDVGDVVHRVHASHVAHMRHVVDRIALMHSVSACCVPLFCFRLMFDLRVGVRAAETRICGRARRSGSRPLKTLASSLLMLQLRSFDHLMIPASLVFIADVIRARARGPRHSADDLTLAEALERPVGSGVDLAAR